MRSVLGNIRVSPSQTTLNPCKSNERLQKVQYSQERAFPIDRSKQMDYRKRSQKLSRLANDSVKVSAQKAALIKTTDLQQPKFYYKGAHSIITQDRGAVAYNDYEYEKLLKLQPDAPICRSIIDFNLQKDHRDQVHTLTTEVLKACNVIRPSFDMLV